MQTVRSRRTLRASPVLAAAIVAQGLLVPNPGAAQTPVRQTPRLRQILVVTANLEEAWNGRDNSDPSDLAAFARRLAVRTPHAPDVLLLQEVSKRSSKKVADLLKTYTHRSYAIAASASDPPADVRPDERRVFTSETSILINRRTMRRVGKPRVIATTYSPRHGSGGGFREIKRNVAVLVRERRSGVRYPIANVHFHTRSQLRSGRLSRRYRAVWVKKVSTALGRRWPHYARRSIIGGDFNAVRARWIRGTKRVGGWWRVLRRRGYRDAVYEAQGRGGVDYVFTRTRIAGVGVDWAYDPRAARSHDYYSDHRLRWALLGPWKPLLKAARGVSSVGVKLTWTPLPGVRWMRVERRRPGEDGWQLAARAGGRASGFYDGGLKPMTRYRYRVSAWNGAERSSRSRTLTARTGPDVVSPRRPQSPRVRIRVMSSGARLAWHRAKDRGGSGTAGYEVWRKRPGRDPVRIGRTRETTYFDEDFIGRPGSEYSLVAYDRVGNRSARSKPSSIISST